MRADFSGWATKVDLVCSDGRTILDGAFKHQDKTHVPLVWAHQANTPTNVLGYAILQHRAGEGVYIEGYFNDTAEGQHAKQLVEHGDIRMLSIFANRLKERNKMVSHGDILEVSLVLKGANPGAVIDNINIRHDDGTVEVYEDEAVIYTGLEVDSFSHAEDDEDEETVDEILDTLNEKQRAVVTYLVGKALEGAGEEDEEDDKGEAAHSDAQDQNDQNDQSGPPAGSTESDGAADGEINHQEGITHMNVFQKNGEAATGESKVLSHEQLGAVLGQAQQPGQTLKSALLAHAQEYGVENLEILFPDFQTIGGNITELIKREDEWVGVVLGGVSRSPFARVRTVAGDITFEEARARGYIKATLKKEGYYKLTKRETTPTTVYVKQKIDRNDVIDVKNGFNVIAWMNANMDVLYREEAARAILFGDGREIDDEFKISEENIRPIIHDDDFYTDKVVIPANVNGEELVEAILRARPMFKGRSTTLFIDKYLLIDLLLIRDRNRRRIYESVNALAAELMVGRIIEIDEILAAQSLNDDAVLAVLVDLSSYNIGTDNGGQLTSFEDFDIDFNQHKMLKEGRFSGALTRRKTAQVFTRASGSTLATPLVPTFANGDEITIPTVTGVIYQINDITVTGVVTITETTEVVAIPANGYFFAHNTDNDWVFVPA